MSNANTVQAVTDIVLSASEKHGPDTGKGHESPSVGLIEIGWILAGPFDAEDLRAIRTARHYVLESLTSQFPDFAWQIPVIRRPELVKDRRVEPTELFDEAVAERDARRWDFCIVITSADLISHYQSDASFFLSRVLQSAILSTSRLDPKAWDDSSDNDERVRAMTRRMVRLILHAIGNWNGLHDALDTNDESRDAGEQYDPVWLAFDDSQLRQIEANLSKIADRRLEEDTPVMRPLTFSCRAAWLNRRDLVRAVWEAKPWQFPLRFSRLTTAAASAMLFMLMTAEVWDLGMNQSVASICLLAGIVIAGTTLYVLVRQRLLVRRTRHRLTEQIVTTNVATTGIVLSGMTTTFFALFLAALMLSGCLFTDSLVSAWAATIADPITLTHYLSLAGFVSSLGITVGALGASFEKHHYFRHVTFVDEEI